MAVAVLQPLVLMEDQVLVTVVLVQQLQFQALLLLSLVAVEEEVLLYNPVMVLEALAEAVTVVGRKMRRNSPVRGSSPARKGSLVRRGSQCKLMCR